MSSQADGEGEATASAETSFTRTSPSTSGAHSSSLLTAQHESVSSTAHVSGNVTEDAPLLPSRYSKGSKHLRMRTGIICLLVCTCTMAGFITALSITLLAVYPETIQGHTQEIFPNDTVLAAPHTGLDPKTVTSVTYSYRAEPDQSDTLSLYYEHCNELQNIVETRILEDSFKLPWPKNYTRVEIDRRYLLEGSNITYTINFTLAAPEHAPLHCYAKLYFRQIHEKNTMLEICNITSAKLSLSPKVTQYYYTIIELTENGGSVQVQSIDVQVSGVQYYFDVSPLHPRCQLNPQNNTSCVIPVKDNDNYNSGRIRNRVCILAAKETPSKGDPFTSLIEYDIMSFGYRQIVLISLVCVGLVVFVCTLGVALSCCTRQGRRLSSRVAMKMTSPLN